MRKFETAGTPGENMTWLTRYGFAAASVALAWLARALLSDSVGDRAQFLAFIIPILVAALYLGRGPALFAMAASLVAGLTFFPKETLGTTSAQIQALVFVVVGTGIIWLGNSLVQAKRTAERHQETAAGEARRAGAIGEELRLLLEGAESYAIFMIGPAGNVLTWNSGAERVFGWREEEVLGRHCSMLAADEDAGARVDAQLAEALAEGRSVGECWCLRADGSEFLADARITPLYDPDRSHRGFAKIIHDITDVRAAEQALAKREQHLRSILATVPDAMVVIDDRGIMISFSAAAERLFGYSEAEALGQNVSMLMPSPDRERHDAYLARYLATGDPHIIGIGRIVTGRRADGTTFPMKLSVGEASTEDQRLFTGFVQDLTERRDFESQLEQLKSELIHVSRLSAMGTMASTLAHELNQPLTAIASYGEAAKSILESDVEADRELLREICGDLSAQALRAGAIVRRLRDFVARGDVAKTVEDLPKLISEASALALVGSKEKGVSAHFHYDPEATPVLVDRVQIQQVLINLMRNAIEAMEPGPVRRLSIVTSLADPATVQVSIADTGPGLAAGVSERLFEAFNSSKEGGMGLGLSICRTIVEAHGGRIQARPAEGGGTEFLFTLMRPAAEASA